MNAVSKTVIAPCVERSRAQTASMFPTLLAAEARRRRVAPRLAAAQRAWSQFAHPDPGRHDPNAYAYVVHSLNQIDLASTKRVYGEGKRVNLLEHPERVADLNVISASLVRNERPVTFGMGVGLILAVPAENVIAAHAVDMQTSEIRNMLERDKAAAAQLAVAKFEKFGLPSPKRLLEMTPPDYFNEVLVTGTSPSGTKVRVAGIFTKAIDGYDPVRFDESVAKRLEAIARAHGIPLIRLESGQAHARRLLDFGWVA